MLKSKLSGKTGKKSLPENYRPLITRDWYIEWKRTNYISELWWKLRNKKKKKLVLESLQILKRIWKIKSDLRSQRRSSSMQTGFKIIKLIKCPQPTGHDKQYTEHRYLKISDLPSEKYIYRTPERASRYIMNIEH